MTCIGFLTLELCAPLFWKIHPIPLVSLNFQSGSLLTAGYDTVQNENFSFVAA